MPICGATGEAGSNCILPTEHPITIAGVSSSAAGVLFYGGAGVVLILGLLGSAGLLQQVSTNLFRAVALLLAIDVVLVVLQVFVWRGICTLCLVTYGITALVAFLLYHPWGARAGAAPPLTIAPAERRMFVGAWVLASAVLLGAVIVGELWARQHARAAYLQLTLDDLDRRDQYDEDKAIAKFRAAPVVAFDLDAVPRFGSPDAPIKIIEFIDYECPVCRQLYGGLDEYLSQNPQVSWYFKNSPLDQSCHPTIAENYHPGACWMARGAICAQQAGKFVEFYRAAFTSERTNPGLADVTAIGTRIGLDRARYTACINAPATAEAVARDVADANRGKAQGTPTLFVNGRRAPLWTYLPRLVAVERGRLGLASPDTAR